MTDSKLAIVFDGPPSNESGRFIEVELDGASISFGEWEQNGDYWELVLPEPYARLAALEAKLAEYENDETPTRRELALVKRKLEAMEQAFRGRGYHEPGMKRCQHGSSHWVGSHCFYDEPALAAQQEQSDD